MMYRFILNQFLMGKGPDYVQNAFQKNLITEEQRDYILAQADPFGEDNDADTEVAEEAVDER